ncbi:MAG: PhoH family protein [Alphaproteobacteria bacterium]
MTDKSVAHLQFDDNRLLSLLFGEHDQHLERIEKALDVTIAARGNTLEIHGDAANVAAAQKALVKLYERLQGGMVISTSEVDTAVRLALAPSHLPPRKPTKDGGLQIATNKRIVTPRSAGQARYIESLQRHKLVFGVGPAGTGKTYLAVAVGVSLLLQGTVDRIILSRPAVEAGEQLGFLPGGIQEKVDPYLRPLYDALHDMLPAEQVRRRMENGEIEVAPLAFMRGRTLAYSYVILDEAQNTTPLQMKMFLTRLGEGSYMVINGDQTQIDLPKGANSGLKHAMHILQGIEDVDTVKLDARDVVRHPLVANIVRAYEDYDATQT